MKTKVFLFTIKKGGVGKTTLAVNQAALLSKHGKTLIIDLDPQGHVIQSFGIDPKKLKNSLATVVEAKIKGKDIPYDHQDLLFTNIQNTGIDVLPCNTDLKIHTESNNKIVYKIIDAIIKNIIKSGKYQYIVIDTNPDYNQLIFFTLLLSDIVVIPYSPDILSNESMDSFIDEYPQLIKLKPSLKIAVVVNKYAIKQKLLTKRDANGKPMKDAKGGVIKEKGIVEDIGYQLITRVKQNVTNLKYNIKFAPFISDTKQYNNALGAYGRPLTACIGKLSASEKKAILEQEELNKFLINL